jgi:hypothetical protein
MKKEETGGWREARGLVHLEVSPQGPALSLRRYIWCPTSSNDVQVAYHVSVYATDHACSNRWAARIRRGPLRAARVSLRDGRRRRSFRPDVCISSKTSDAMRSIRSPIAKLGRSLIEAKSSCSAAVDSHMKVLRLVTAGETEQVGVAFGCLCSVAAIWGTRDKEHSVQITKHERVRTCLEFSAQ